MPAEAESEETHWDGEAPKRDKSGALMFEDAPDFKPNLTPAEVLQRGSFGGTYFRNIHSEVTGETYKDTWKELPKEWIKGLDVKAQLASTKYDTSVNTYGVNCGAKLNHSDTSGLAFWEHKGWIEAQDPYGWFMWYCRFYQGRRSPDDARQISRWKKCAGPTGRWRNNLIGKVMAQQAEVDDKKVSPVVRQTLQHWGYKLTQADYDQGAKKRRGGGGSSKNSAAEQPASESSGDADSDSRGSKRKAKEQASARARRARRRNEDNSDKGQTSAKPQPETESQGSE
mmetsp:Transcript_6148/g.15661  ORF Transcript_6148/g.15661 Transcript_6148/m.15661 type:complete len:284 (+) Transcript_6148:228-1079(+)